LQDPLQPLPSFRCFRCIKYRVLDKQQIGFEEDVRDRAKHEKKQAASEVKFEGRIARPVGLVASVLGMLLVVVTALSSGYAGPSGEIGPVLGARIRVWGCGGCMTPALRR
jgi:hypothetical protein